MVRFVLACLSILFLGQSFCFALPSHSRDRVSPLEMRRHIPVRQKSSPPIKHTSPARTVVTRQKPSTPDRRVLVQQRKATVPVTKSKTSAPVPRKSPLMLLHKATPVQTPKKPTVAQRASTPKKPAINGQQLKRLPKGSPAKTPTKRPQSQLQSLSVMQPARTSVVGTHHPTKQTQLSKQKPDQKSSMRKPLQHKQVKPSHPPSIKKDLLRPLFGNGRQGIFDGGLQDVLRNIPDNIQLDPFSHFQISRSSTFNRSSPHSQQSSAELLRLMDGTPPVWGGVQYTSCTVTPPQGVTEAQLKQTIQTQHPILTSSSYNMAATSYSQHNTVIKKTFGKKNVREQSSTKSESSGTQTLSWQLPDGRPFKVVLNK